MLGENHDVIHEFPEYEAKIRELAANSQKFSDLMKRYEDLDSRVRNLEEQAQPVADETMEDLKKQRLMFKDELYSMLRD